MKGFSFFSCLIILLISSVSVAEDQVIPPQFHGQWAEPGRCEVDSETGIIIGSTGIGGYECGWEPLLSHSFTAGITDRSASRFPALAG